MSSPSPSSQVDENLIYIPIPHYPPFKLRSSLIDKDPVIWVHLLEAYINLFKFLISPESQVKRLNVKSQQQLQLFLKVFLFETSEETSKIFSLGAINPDITTNTTILRAYVFQLIKSYSFVKLSLTGESIWHFITIYAKNNASTVRGLVDGTFKSKYNDNKKSGNISSISSVHKYLEGLISNGQFKQADLTTLSYLLGQHTSAGAKTKTFNISGANSNNPKTKSINKNLTNSSNFAEKFVDTNFIEILEKLYVNGRGVHAKTVEKIMVVSIISLSTAKVANLVTGLGINQVKALILSPLLSTVIISDAYSELNPGLEERLPFLRKLTFVGDNSEDELSEGDSIDVSPEHISLLQDLFPQLTNKQAITVLKENNGDVEHVTNILLENPDSISDIKEYEPKRKSAEDSQEAQRRVANELKKAQARFKNFDNGAIVQGKHQMSKKEVSNPEDLKKKTLSAALKLMYEDDEDEPDDTYDEQEKTTGAAVDDPNAKGNKGNASSKFKVLVDDDAEASPSRKRGETPPPRTESKIDLIERYLFSVYKTKGEESFNKTARKSSLRQTMKKSTGWSDEQIEGWLRMLHKSPKRYKLLEEYFLFGGGNPNRGPQPPPIEKLNLGDSESPQPKPSQIEKKAKSDQKSNESNDKTKAKKDNAKNEKNKASRANHNRKTGHNKKMAAQTAGMRQ